jgi:4-aminobutyrate aminotransferase-like enzyme
MRAMLEQGFLILPCGERGEALGFSPPLGIGQELLDASVEALRRCLAAG